ncbi:MAG TPA: flagellar hook-basal body protein FliE [Rhodospirillales bacterium]|nr:flagellar hook-basal body protein FliE [Rhodospirillales bacterium]
MAVPIQNLTNALSAYAQAPAGGTVGMNPRDGQGGSEFADLVKGAIKQAVTIGERSEAISIAAIQDRADINEVVTAIAEAEITLRSVVAVRDKVVEAYREILRMPV